VKRLRERACAVARARAFFESRGFLEVDTPSMVPSPGLDLHLDAFEIAGGDRGGHRWLSTSPEYQMKRLLAEGWPRIFQVAHCFRRGEHGSAHNSEFTMLEWYRANAGVEDVMADTEQLVASMTGGGVRLLDRQVDLHPPFERLSVCDAFSRFAGWSASETLAAASADEQLYFRTFVEQVDPGLGRFDRGVFLVDYPASQASLARRKPDDARLAERFELYVAGIELCNGFGELVDPVEQRARLLADQERRKSAGLPVYPLDESFLAALARTPPSAGNALGLDRLVALTCGERELGPVLAFTADEL
jgi:lysyl-tRNA synthetase class 2